MDWPKQTDNVIYKLILKNEKSHSKYNKYNCNNNVKDTDFIALDKIQNMACIFTGIN